MIQFSSHDADLRHKVGKGVLNGGVTPKQTIRKKHLNEFKGNANTVYVYKEEAKEIQDLPILLRWVIVRSKLNSMYLFIAT